MKRIVVRNGVRYGRTRIVAPYDFDVLVYCVARAFASRGIVIDPIRYTANVLRMSRGSYFKYRRGFLDRLPYLHVRDPEGPLTALTLRLQPGLGLLAPIQQKDSERRLRRFHAACRWQEQIMNGAA